MENENETSGSDPTVAALIAAPSIAEVWRIFGDALAEIGFNFLIYGGTKFSHKGMIGNIQEALILHRGPQEYADIYIDEELYLHSPTYEWAENNSGFASWPDAIRAFGRAPSPEQMRIMQLNAKFGMAGGYVGSLNDIVPGMTGVIGLSPGNMVSQNEADEIWARSGARVETLSNLMHLRVSSLPQTGQRRPLTTRQREALEWYSEGKTAQDIATIMDLSIRTVEKHLRLARESLDAQTTAHAVMKATTLNLLSA